MEPRTSRPDCGDELPGDDVARRVRVGRARSERGGGRPPAPCPLPPVRRCVRRPGRPGRGAAPAGAAGGQGGPAPAATSLSPCGSSTADSGARATSSPPGMRRCEPPGRRVRPHVIAAGRSASCGVRSAGSRHRSQRLRWGWRQRLAAVRAAWDRRADAVGSRDGGGVHGGTADAALRDAADAIRRPAAGRDHDGAADHAPPLRRERRPLRRRLPRRRPRHRRPRLPRPRRRRARPHLHRLRLRLPCRSRPPPRRRRGCGGCSGC